MKIISKFHDYYDSVQGYGIDATILYKRKIKELNFYDVFQKDANVFIPLRLDDKCKTGEDKTIYIKKEPISFFFSLVGFCGKIYRCIKITKGTKSYYIYNIDELKKILYQIGFTNSHKIFQENKNYFRKKYISFYMSMINYLTTPVVDKKYIDIFQTYKIPYYSIQLKHVNNRNIIKLILNSSLKKLQFQKVIDPFTAHQEIEMYISGVLGLNDPKIIEISDKYKIEKRGFNDKSFRKEKKGKKKNKSRD